MSLTYNYVPHSSRTLTEGQTSEEQNPSNATLSIYLQAHSAERNPHDLPSFDSDVLINPQAPILYLPPLLSSLPGHISTETVSQSENQPLVTETRLPDIDPVSLSLHKALHHFQPIDNRYSSASYAEAFNWSKLVLPEEEEREWYCVVFRSKRKAGSDGPALYLADRLAHEEAVSNGGLIMYWYGTPDQSTGMNLATCIWQSRKHAMAAIARPHHIKGMRLAAASYDVYTLERHILRKEKGRSDLTIYPYVSGEVGW